MVTTRTWITEPSHIDSIAGNSVIADLPKEKYVMQTVYTTAPERTPAIVSTFSTEDAGKLVLRIALATLLLFHGVSKLMGGIGFITGMLAKAGLPPAVGYLVYIGEVVAPLLILLGIYTRAAALVIVINMIVALLLVHAAQF